MTNTKKLLLTFSLFIFLTAFQTQEKEVFICTTKSSKTYHLKKECKGLKRCKSKIKKITKKKAENVGRILCKLEKKEIKTKEKS
ncbi:hypothetical protein [Polaribacter sp. Hel1_85]|uniref:hypothetical protein n=1 Tax=Polaribacter sp. Hel1_85 TaxID=1250005 RepID=UPI00052DC820|nr:hypothetical protein [Polaribacter sp. Hel1_85]KGL62932.1 hypothetical protein PHEL85_2728 [Polaribacter sp. Hel1_85]